MEAATHNVAGIANATTENATQQKDLLDRIWHSFLTIIYVWCRYESKLAELSLLSDLELAGIGISRSDIPRVAWNSAYQD